MFHGKLGKIKMDAHVTIIGAGVVGLAIASELGDEHTFLLEKNPTFGQETSSRNSEVIHAGIYYKPNSLKANLCIQGNALLYDLCERYDISYKKIGKLIVATNQDEGRYLEELLENASNCSVQEISMLSKDQISTIEPNILADTALFSASTGIINSHELMQYYLAQARSKGTEILYNSTLTGISHLGSGYLITIDSPDGPVEFTSEIVINAAGLHGAEVANLALQEKLYHLHYCKGDYFSVSSKKSKLVSHLIYPAPHKNIVGLGVHVTLDLNGQMRLGPDTEYVNDLSYGIAEDKRQSFYLGAKRFLPFLELDDLNPDFSGIRPKIQGPKGGFKDFVIREEPGLPGMINLIGIESPGLTASLAIARYVKKIIRN